MEAGREARLTGLEEDEHGVKIPVLRSTEEDSDHVHRRQIGQFNSICKGDRKKILDGVLVFANHHSLDPLAPDPFESKFVYVDSSRYYREAEPGVKSLKQKYHRFPESPERARACSQGWR